jgi:hypothetical protein
MNTVLRSPQEFKKLYQRLQIKQHVMSRVQL